MFVCDGTQRKALLWGAIFCGLLVAGCTRNGHVVTKGDWGFLDPTRRASALAEPSWSDGRNTSVAGTGDPFLSDSADDAPAETEPVAQLVSTAGEPDLPPPEEPAAQTVRSLPLAGSKSIPVTPWPDEDVAEVRVSANRPAVARTLPPEPPLTAPLEELQSTQSTPEATLKRTEALPSDAPLSVEESTTIAILPEGNLPLPDPPSVVITPLADSVVLLEAAPSAPDETVPAVPAVAESATPVLVDAPGSLEETPGPLEDTPESLRPYRRVASPQQVSPQLDARPVLPPPSPNATLPAPAREVATLVGGIEIEPGEALPLPTETRQIARTRFPPLASPGRLPLGVASEVVPEISPSDADLLAPVPLESFAWPRLTTASRFGLFIGLTGLAGLLAWRAFERRRFQSASRT